MVLQYPRLMLPYMPWRYTEDTVGISTFLIANTNINATIDGYLAGLGAPYR